MRERRTGELRKGRLSLAGARYFVTICARRPEQGLVDVAMELMAALARFEPDGDGTLMASTVMPDHLHFLATLSGRLTIGQMVGKLKSLTRQILREQETAWQDNFFEHRLRPEDRAGDYARYIFLNPYRAGLISRDAEWPWWRCSPSCDYDFLQMLENGRFPPPEWLEMDLETLGLSTDKIGGD